MIRVVTGFLKNLSRAFEAMARLPKKTHARTLFPPRTTSPTEYKNLLNEVGRQAGPALQLRRVGLHRAHRNDSRRGLRQVQAARAGQVQAAASLSSVSHLARALLSPPPL